MFLFWYQTWFGRPLSDQEMTDWLTDTSAPHKTQHAMTQLAARMSRRDPAVKRWYPQLIALAETREPGLRLMAAWAMGQDDQSQEFHEELRKLLQDTVPMVRWNAALALVRFHDAAGEQQLRTMLRPLSVLASQGGSVVFRVKEGEEVNNGSLLAEVQGLAGVAQVRSPLAGRVERLGVADGTKVNSGETIACLAPGAEQVWESLRALYLVGREEDLDDVERFARGVPGMPEGVRRQAALTAQAIRLRAKKSGE